MKINSSYISDLTAFESRLNILANAPALTLNSDGQLIANKIFGGPFEVSKVSREVVEFNVMKFLVENKQHLNQQNWSTVLELAKKVGYDLSSVPNLTKTQKSHPELFKTIFVLRAQCIEKKTRLKIC